MSSKLMQLVKANTKEPQAASDGNSEPAPADLAEQLKKLSIDVTDADLKELSQQTPSSNRPSAASIYLEEHWRGFPLMLIFEIAMVLEFEDAQQLACADWNPAGDFPSQEMINSKDCEVPGDELPDRILGFDPGQRINISFSRLTGSSIDGLGLDDGYAISLRGGQLVLSEECEIVTRRWNRTSIQSDGFNSYGGVVGSAGRSDRVIGRYYLDGNIITIATIDGDVVYGFIGYSKDGDGSIQYVYFNGEQYSDRSD